MFFFLVHVSHSLLLLLLLIVNYYPTGHQLRWKVFLLHCTSRITAYMCQNGYFDGLTQKGFLPGIAGCIEHATMSHEAIRDARLHHRNICFAWLDLKNVFGSIKHMFIQTCLSRYHFPPSLSKLVFNYYENLIAKVSVSTSTLTKPFHYATGVFPGCVLSPFLFNICFQPLLGSRQHRI